MKNSRSNRAIVALTVILIASAVAVAFIKSDDRKQDPTDYYWYDAYGNYTGRHWTVYEEMDFTSYDDLPYSPNTLRERGYPPTGVTGDPPVPNNPYNPAIRLYSHP